MTTLHCCQFCFSDSQELQFGNNFRTINTIFGLHYNKCDRAISESDLQAFCPADGPCIRTLEEWEVHEVNFVEPGCCKEDWAEAFGIFVRDELLEQVDTLVL